jgi:hypothetical protein
VQEFTDGVTYRAESPCLLTFHGFLLAAFAGDYGTFLMHAYLGNPSQGQAAAFFSNWNYLWLPEPGDYVLQFGTLPTSTSGNLTTATPLAWSVLANVPAAYAQARITSPSIYQVRSTPAQAIPNPGPVGGTNIDPSGAADLYFNGQTWPGGRALHVRALRLSNPGAKALQVIAGRTDAPAGQTVAVGATVDYPANSFGGPTAFYGTVGLGGTTIDCLWGMG